MGIDLNQSPFFDDFDPSKNYHRVLFRPSFAVQARELTTLQTILQNQVKEFGKNIFKNGSIVTGGQIMLEVTSVQYVCIEATDPNGNAIDVANFIGKFIVDGDGSGVRAYVIAGAAATITSPTVLIVKYTSGQIFDIATVQPIATEDGVYTVNLLASLLTPIHFTDVTSASILGDSSICSIGEGVFFMDGFFVQVDTQTLILDAFDNTPTFRVGLQTDDEIIDATSDASLLDPAQDATNFQAPGANRYKFALSLVKRSLTSTDDTKFIELLRVSAGQLIKKIVYPTYSVIEDTLARRTNDQSGSFTVRPFKIAFENDATFANAYTVVVEAGKAYVQGYEFETIAPFRLKSERARAVANVANYNTNIDFQNWVEVTKLVGPIPFKTLQSGVIHCVNTANIATGNAEAAANTVIGTVRLRALDYQSGANATSISTGVWRAYAFDTNVGHSITANSSALGSANTIHLANNFSSVNSAYAGVKFTVTANAGVALNESHTIGVYVGANNLATLQGTETFAFGIPDQSTQYRLDYEFKDAEAIVYSNTTTAQNIFSTTMDINDSSKDAVLVDPYMGAFLSDTDFNRALIQLPFPTIADQTVVGGVPLSSTEYFGRKVYVNQGFSANVMTIISASGITSAVNGSPLSGSDAIDNILVVIRNNTGTTIANNQVINFSTGNGNGNTVATTTTSNTSTWTITIPGAGSAASADVYVKVKLPFSHAIGNLLRTKSARLANVANALVTGGTTMPDVSGLVQWYSQGSGTLGAQINIYANSTAWTALKDSRVSQSLFVADATRLAKVVDLGVNAITDANVASGSDITARYTLDSGQRDNSYDHASINLKPESQGPVGNVVVYVDYLTHSGLGYLTVDSYASANISYANIPSYISATTGFQFNLRDCVDFRPRRQDADTQGIFDEELFGISGLDFETDFSYYLARIDKIILTKDLTFEVLQGVSSLVPVPPADKDNAMTLYTLQLPAYTATTREIRQSFVDNRRYTMRDIGTLEKRITNLEYYTSLNLLEQAAKNQEITDDTGANRFKNGILVDAFTGHSIGDVLNPDYHCAMDPQNQELRPPFAVQALALDLSITDSSHYGRTGAILSLPFTETTFIDQPFASQAINLNPFNTISFIGQIQLDPSSDTWIDINRIPDLHVNMEGDNDAWAALTATVNAANPGKIFGTTWNSWQTNWTGVSKTSKVINPRYIGHQPGPGHVVQIYAPIINRTTTSTTQKQVRTGIQTSFAPEVIQTSIGDKVIDESVIARMRSKGVLFTGKMFAPNTNLYAFFDSTAVTNYCNLPSVVKVISNTVSYIDTYQEGESVRVWSPIEHKNTAHGIVILSRNEDSYTNVSVVSVTGGDDANVANSYFLSLIHPTFLIGEISGATSQISGYYHNTGFVTDPGTTSIVLQHDVANSNVGISNTTIVGETIYFTSANGLGQKSTITAYNFVTRNVSFSPALTVTPNTQTTYSIGQLQSDYRGEVAGVFIIPSTEDINFRTGERQFTLVDSTTGAVEFSGTNGSVKYFASGLLETVQNTIISTRQMAIQQTVVTENRTIVSNKVTNAVIGQKNIGYYDPLAQTFLVDQNFHPSGIMLTGIRLLFKTKDSNIPVQVQIRPVVNGFPDSSKVIPGADVVINPSDITIVDEIALGVKYSNTGSGGSNPFDDASMYTQINFAGPIYLVQGAEYAVVLIANSVKYQVYISNLGSKILGTERILSSQPYLGVLFKSQNSTTWNPIQEQDLAFRMLYAQFDTTVTANVGFQLSASNDIVANVPLDTLYVTSGNLLLPNTTITSMFATTTTLGNKQEAAVFQGDENVYFDDNLGRRVATSDVSSFKLRLLLQTLNADISPLVDMDRLSVLAIENLVNTLGFSNSSMVVTSSSSNWQTAANLTLTITGGGGSGANAFISNTNIDQVNHVLSNVIVDVTGSGYTTAPTVTLSGNNTISANISVVGEDHPFGGPSVARYITRMVTLADGLDAGDFRVYFSAYKPSNANIFVYYKILSADDADIFDNKSYQLMTIIQGFNNVSQNQNDIKDFVYAPGADNIADDRVQYGSFVSFKYFAIKVVMYATDTTKVPRLREFRVVAIPSLS